MSKENTKDASRGMANDAMTVGHYAEEFQKSLATAQYKVPLETGSIPVTQPSTQPSIPQPPMKTGLDE